MIVSKQLFTYFHERIPAEKNRLEMMKLACPPAESSTRVGGGHFQTPIASLITNVTSTKRH